MRKKEEQAKDGKTWQRNERDPEQNSALAKVVTTKINCYLLSSILTKI